MKVQPIDTVAGERYILIGDDYEPVWEVNKYLKFQDNIGRSPNTQRSYAHDLCLFYRFMTEQGYEPMNLCMDKNKGPVDILGEFVLWLQYPDYTRGILHFGSEDAARSDETVNRVMSTVLMFYRYLAQNKMIEQLDVYKFQLAGGQFKPFLYSLVKNKREVQSSIFKKPIIKKPVEAITRKQYDELYSLCRSRRDKLLVAILFEGGLRINEALGLHICDVTQIEDGIVNIVARENNENGARVKRQAEGIIILPDYVIDLLVDYITEDLAESVSDFLFINQHGKTAGLPMRSGNVTKLFEGYSKKLGYHVNPHMLRHGFAQEKLEAGWPLEQVQSYLRHRNPTSTEIYAQYTDAMKMREMKGFFLANNLSKEF